MGRDEGLNPGLKRFSVRRPCIKYFLEIVLPEVSYQIGDIGTVAGVAD